MPEKHLNIISFDVPYPPDYGGVIDVYFKIEALFKAGVKVHLHTFHYGRNDATILNEICESVSYYKRIRFGSIPDFNLPYIVKTRKSKALLENLTSNDYPILFEGLHCTYYANHPKLKGRKKIVRMHNIEYVYYKHLAKVEKNFIKKFYFNFEADRLRKYHLTLSDVDFVAAISPSDHKILNLKHGNSIYLPVFHQNNEVVSKSGKGEYILYHGNLGVGENNEAALYLVNEVLNDCKIPTIIAGNNPSKDLVNSVKQNYHIKLMNPSIEELNDLIQNAHINVLPTFQDTGIKLKLLNALFQGRFCLVNSKMAKDTGLEDVCIISDDAKKTKKIILKLFEAEFTYSDIAKRKEHLMGLFDNNQNITPLLEII